MRSSSGFHRLCMSQVCAKTIKILKQPCRPALVSTLAEAFRCSRKKVPLDCLRSCCTGSPVTMAAAQSFLLLQDNAVAGHSKTVCTHLSPNEHNTLKPVLCSAPMGGLLGSLFVVLLSRACTLLARCSRLHSGSKQRKRL